VVEKIAKYVGPISLSPGFGVGGDIWGGGYVQRPVDYSFQVG
jgi:hypothetical protein